MNNNSSPGNRFTIIIIATFVGLLFFGGGYMSAKVVAKNESAKKDLQSAPALATADIGSKTPFPQAIEDKSPGKSAPVITPVKEESKEQLPTGLVQEDIQVKKPIFTIGPIAFTGKRLIIIAVVTVLLLVAAFFLYLEVEYRIKVTKELKELEEYRDNIRYGGL